MYRKQYYFTYMTNPNILKYEMTIPEATPRLNDGSSRNSAKG